MTTKNLFEMFEEKANATPERFVAYCVNDKANITEKLTYRKLQCAAKSLASYLAQHYQRGDRVLVMTTHGLEYYIAMFGCFYAGLTVVPIAPPNPANLEYDLAQIKKIFDSSQAKCMLSTRVVQQYLDIVTDRQTQGWSIKSFITKFIIKSRIKQTLKFFGKDELKPIKMIDELPPILYIEDLAKQIISNGKNPKFPMTH